MLPASARLEGYREALTEAGIPIREEYIECCDGMTDVKVENLTKKLLYLPLDHRFGGI